MFYENLTTSNDVILVKYIHGNNHAGENIVFKCVRKHKDTICSLSLRLQWDVTDTICQRLGTGPIA